MGRPKFKEAFAAAAVIVVTVVVVVIIVVVVAAVVVVMPRNYHRLKFVPKSSFSKIAGDNFSHQRRNSWPIFFSRRKCEY